MKKRMLALLTIGVLLVAAMGFAACGGGKDKTYKVSFMDGTTVLKTVEVKEGETVERYTPTKDGGYQFVDWFATPSKNHTYDFTTAINSDVQIYAGFTLYKEDTRTYYIVGSGTSELLLSSNWGKVLTDEHKMTKAADKNEYKLTCDVKAGDQFQFAISTKWENKRGFGYMASLKTPDGKTAFSGEGSVYDDSSKGSNIKCELSGNYTFTLKTYPNEDYYNESSSSYTEADREVYNIGTYDKIEWVRNGDVVNDTVTVTDFHIKGAKITNWKDMFNVNTRMVRSGSNYTMTIYLKEGEEFMFTSRVAVTKDGVTTYSDGTDCIKAENLTAESKAFIDGEKNNMTAKKSGMYTFSYDNTTKKAAVTFEEKAPTAMEYYVDGDCWGNWNLFADPDKTADYKLTETAAGSGIFTITKELKAGKQLQIRACKAGETPTTSNTANDIFQFGHLAANKAFEQFDAKNENIKVKTAGTYVITFDSYSKIITITAAEA